MGKKYDANTQYNTRKIQIRRTRHLYLGPAEKSSVFRRT